MNEIERFLFDVNGYLVVPDALTPTQVAAINLQFDEHLAAHSDPDAGSTRFQRALDWRGPMLGLIDNPRVLPYLEELCGPQVRLDHTYAVSIRPGFVDGGAWTLHGNAIPFMPAHHYGVHDGRVSTGEVAVAYNLTEVPEGAGGFGCIPGSHKSNFAIPDAFRDLRKPQPAVRSVAGPAGSAIIFTETLAHGTLPWIAKHDRRTVFFKYTPHCIALYERYLDEAASAWDELSDRQRELLEAPNVRDPRRERRLALADMPRS
jgi:ectoine hydroxylase-related dioxygenase (phytanoyl-CoA dioxygenase family)